MGENERISLAWIAIASVVFGSLGFGGMLSEPPTAEPEYDSGYSDPLSIGQASSGDTFEPGFKKDSEKVRIVKIASCTAIIVELIRMCAEALK